MTGLVYPYTKYDRLLGDNIALDLEMNPAATPPSGTAGGAGRYKYWVDTTNPANASLRQCIASRATAGVYVPGEWITLGTIDIAAAKFHFNNDQVDFTGGTGPLIVRALTVTGATNLNTLTVSGATSLNTLSVSGATNLSTLNVSGASALHDTNITGVLNVSGAITGGSLNTASWVAGGSLSISGASALHDTSVTGNLTASGNISASGTITGGALATGGNLNVGGVATVGSMPSLHVTGNTTIDGALAVGGAISGASLGVTGSINGAGLGITGNANINGTLGVGGSITGASLGVTGAITGASLHITGNGTIDGALAVGGAVTAASFSTPGGSLSANTVEAEQYRIIEGGTSYMFANMGTDVGALATLILGPEFATSAQARISIYNTLQTYMKADEHNFWGSSPPYATFAVFNSSGTANITGSWAVISDDSVKENVAPYTAGLAEILQLDPVSYNYVIPQAGGLKWSPFAVTPHATPPTRYGMMASNVLAVIPEMVTEMTFSDIAQGIPDTPLATIAPTHLCWVLTNAVKELSAKDDALDTRIDTIESVHSVFAPLASPAFTGTPTAPTAPYNTASTQLATTAFVRNGTTTNDSALVGQIGEFQAAQVLSTAPINLATGVDTSLVTLSLGAGDWDVYASAGFNMSNPNNVVLRAWVNPTGAATAPAIDQMGGQVIVPAVNNTSQALLPLTPMRVSLGATTAIRLGTTVVIGGGTVAAWGKLLARRVR